MDPLILLAIGAAVVMGGILLLRLHAFLALVLGAVVVAWLTPSTVSVGERVGVAFGETCGKVGLLIALASVVGKAMLDSGAADRIVRSIVQVLGERRAPLALLVAGFILGSPVFFETAVLLLFPLAKAMAARNDRNYLLLILSIVAGASMSHSLVPPTPGPVAVASELNVNIGVMMLGGVVVGAFASSAGFAYAVWANRRFPIPLRATDELSLDELQSLIDRPDAELPPLWAAVLPIVVPALLIGSRAAAVARFDEDKLATGWWALLNNVGEKNIAIAMGAVMALTTLAWKRRTSAREMMAGLQPALAGAGVLILIIGAGGAFGRVLQESGIGERIEQLAGDYQLPVLPLAFLLTTLIRTAQGSATVAMITAGGILKGFTEDPAALGFHPVYLALAIGCGSKPFPWMNDSGFWMIGRMAGFTERETLRTSSAMISIMGCAGMVVVMVLAKVLPMTPV